MWSGPSCLLVVLAHGCCLHDVLLANDSANNIIGQKRVPEQPSSIDAQPAALDCHDGK
jgi:hypothetical protein